MLSFFLSLSSVCIGCLYWVFSDGMTGRVEGLDQATGRYTVRLESSGEQIRVKATNLREAGEEGGSNNSNNPRAAAEALARQAVALGRQHQVDKMLATAEDACVTDPTYCEPTEWLPPRIRSAWTLRVIRHSIEVSFSPTSISLQTVDMRCGGGYWPNAGIHSALWLISSWRMILQSAKDGTFSHLPHSIPLPNAFSSPFHRRMSGTQLKRLHLKGVLIPS